MKKLCFIFLISITLAHSQSTYNASVFSLKTNQPLSDVSIRIKNSRYGTYSDSLGKFKLNNLKALDTILISSIGYETQQIVFNVDSNNPSKIFLEEQITKIQEVVIKEYKNTGKWKKVFRKEKVRISPPILFEGTIMRRKANNLPDIINGLRFYLLNPSDSMTVTARPVITDLEGKTLLLKDYTTTFHLDKNKKLTINFDFLENVDIPKEGVYLGIETIRIPNNNNYYEKSVLILCSQDDVLETEVITITNLIPQEGIGHNFDKILSSNLYLEVRVPK